MFFPRWFKHVWAPLKQLQLTVSIILPFIRNQKKSPKHLLGRAPAAVSNSSEVVANELSIFSHEHKEKRERVDEALRGANGDDRCEMKGQKLPLSSPLSGISFCPSPLYLCCVSGRLSSETAEPGTITLHRFGASHQKGVMQSSESLWKWAIWWSQCLVHLRWDPAPKLGHFREHTERNR